MCRQVKSIEIIEFGHEKSDDGVNGAKSAYCVDKHKGSISKPYHAALKESHPSHGAADQIRSLHTHWLEALHSLKWIPGESWMTTTRRESSGRTRRSRSAPLPCGHALAESLKSKAAAVKKKFERKQDSPAKPAKPPARLASAKDPAN